VIARIKSALQVLMIVLALGTAFPATLSFAGSAPGECISCSCCPAAHPDKPCEPSCAFTHLPASDAQLAARGIFTPPAKGSVLLFSIADTKVRSSAHDSVIPRWERDFSPPFGGSPPQAVMCLWLI
jgi:hypothetical protein